MLQVGQQAPAFDAVASDGRRITLDGFRGKKNLVLYFYPRDFTRVSYAGVDSGATSRYKLFAGRRCRTT
jgi:peroxiredoxin